MSRTSKSPRRSRSKRWPSRRAGAADVLQPRSAAVTLAQHFACLVLKSFFRTDYRGIVAILADLPDLRGTGADEGAALHHAAEGRPILCFGPFGAVSRRHRPPRLGEQPRVELAAGDSTGIEASQISPYFINRRCPGGNASGHELHALPEAGTAVRLPHAPGARRSRARPGPDTDRLRPLVFAGCGGVASAGGLFDAGYDSEPNHVSRQRLPGVRRRHSRRGRPAAQGPGMPPGGRCAAALGAYRDFRYGQRRQAETRSA